MADNIIASSSSGFKGKGEFWVTEPTAEIPIRVGKEGIGARLPTTVMHTFRETVRRFPTKNALNVKRDGEWKKWTWREYHDDVMRVARSLIHFDFQPHQVVSILGFNAPEWFFSILGAIAAGGIGTGIYTTNGPEACRYILDHSGTAVVIVENENQLKKILAIKDKLPKLKAVVQYSGQVPSGVEGVLSWEQFLELGNNVDQGVVEKRIGNTRPGHCAALVYTSGTTGSPKAVMLSNDNVTWNAAAVLDTVGSNLDDIIISYLPLSHIAAQIIDIFCSMTQGSSTFFAQPDALKGSLGATLKEVHPTAFMGVPRVWEKMEEKMREVGRQTPGYKAVLAGWAKEVGLQNGYADQGVGTPPWGVWIADKLVFSKVKQALGLENCRIQITSAAPIAKETLEFFLSFGIPVCEVYGMSETAGPITVNTPTRYKTASCGPCMGGIELKVDRPDAEGNGELCFRSRNNFMGYMYDDKATAETIDAEGYLHSGDVGIARDAFLYITGRIKEILITAGGENVAPVPIEDEIKKVLGNVISNVMVIGDRRKFLSCVFTIKTVPVAVPQEGEYPLTNDLAPEVISILESVGSSAKTIEQAVNDENLKTWLQRGIDIANKNAVSAAQQVRKFFIVDHDFVIENDLLTPTLKLKRRNVLQKYSQQIEEVYNVPSE